MQIKKSTNTNVPIYMDGNTGLTITCKISKNGASLTDISPVISEIGIGWYDITLSPSNTDTKGYLLLSCAASGYPDKTEILEVVDNLESDTYTAATSIKAKTDQLEFTGAYINSQIKASDNIDFGALQKTSLNSATPSVTVSDKTGFSLAADYDAAKSAIAIADLSATETSILNQVASDISTSEGIIINSITDTSDITNAILSDPASGVGEITNKLIYTISNIGVLLDRLTDTRASLMDNLSRLDDTISSRVSDDDFVNFSEINSTKLKYLDTYISDAVRAIRYINKE